MKAQAVNFANNSTNGMVQSKREPSIFLRCPEIETVARKALWLNFLTDKSVLIRGNFPLHRLTNPLQWNINPFSNSSWLLFYHSLYFLGTLYHGAVGYSESEDQRKSTVAFLKNLIFSYFDFLDTQAADPRIPAWDDHSTSYRASYLSLIYENLLEPLLNSSDKERYIVVMRRHSMVLLKYINSGKWKGSNHTIFQIEGLMDISLVFFDRTGEGGLLIEHCASIFCSYVEGSVSVLDGTTKEHAHFYHPFLMERIRVHHQYLALNKIEVQIDVLAVLRKMNYFMWLSMPERGLVPSIGDTKYSMHINEKFYRAFLDESYINPEIEYFVTGGTSGKCPPFFHQFREDGYYLFRDSKNLDSGLFSTFLEKRVVGPHGHFDGGSFVTYLGPHPIFIDSGGPYKYRDPLRHSYFQTQLAHNTLIVEAPIRHHSEVIASISGLNYAFIASRAEMGFGNIWLRIFGQIASNLIVVVDLAICEDVSTPIQLRYHLAPEARFVDCADGQRILNIADHKVYISFQDTDVLSFDSKIQTLDEFRNSPRGFDSTLFPVTDQTMAIITRKDDEYERGNLICRHVEAMRPVVMLAGFDQPPNVKVLPRSQGLDLELAELNSVWAGGRLGIDWLFDGMQARVALTLTPNTHDF